MRPVSDAFTLPGDERTSETVEATASNAGDSRSDDELYTGLPSGRAALTVQEFCRWAGVSRSTFYNLIAANELKVRKIGNRTVVLCSDALTWLEALPVVGAEPASEVDLSAAASSAGAAPLQSKHERFLSASEVARRFDCSIRTVRRWIADGDLPAVTVGGLCRIAECDVEAMVRKHV
jgi:excisionase family DNA binding protein